MRDALAWEADWRKGPWFAGLGVAYALVHAAYYAAGLRYERGALREVMHYLDPELLREDLLQSLWHLHIQPPLMNLYVGLVLKLTPESPVLFHLSFLGFGLILYFSVFLLATRLGVGRWLAAALAIGFMASPAFLLLEHFLLYTLPCAAFLAAAALSLHHALANRSPLALAAFFALIFLLCGTRTMFHLGYYVLVWGAVLVYWRGGRRTALLIGAAPFLLLCAFYAKNAAVFGGFNVSSFASKNLWIMTAGNLPWDEKVALVAAGELSEMALTNRWAALDEFPEEYHAVPPRFADAPALTQTHKSTGGVNYNHYGRIAISEVYGEDARYVLRHRPWVYVVSVAFSAYRYFQPAHGLPILPEAQEQIRPVIRVYDRFVFWKIPEGWVAGRPWIARAGHPPYLGLLIGLPLALGYGLWRVWRPGRLDPAQRAVVLFCCFNIVMVAGLGCALDFLETARYRFMTDGLSLVLFGMFVQDAWRRLCYDPGDGRGRNAHRHDTGPDGQPTAQAQESA